MAPRAKRENPATPAAPRVSGAAPSWTAVCVGAQHDVGVEDGEQRVEVALAGGREERVDELGLPQPVGVRSHVLSLHPASRAAGELPGGRCAAPDDRRDLVERHGEHVVQHEGDALGGRQRVEHDQQGEADGVGQQRLLLGIGRRGGDRRPARARRGRTAPRGRDRARLQHVQAHPRDDRGQPAAAGSRSRSDRSG